LSPLSFQDDRTFLLFYGLFLCIFLFPRILMDEILFLNLWYLLCVTTRPSLHNATNSIGNFSMAETMQKLLPPPLPPGWKAQLDTTHNRFYYYEEKTRQQQWNPPELVLPNGWSANRDAKGRQYYMNLVFNYSSWTFPTEPAEKCPKVVELCDKENPTYIACIYTSGCSSYNIRHLGASILRAHSRGMLRLLCGRVHTFSDRTSQLASMSPRLPILCLLRRQPL